MVYPNIKAEMARKNLTVEGLSLVSGIKFSTLSAKLNGKRDLTYPEAVKIKQALNVDIPLETLFVEGAV